MRNNHTFFFHSGCIVLHSHQEFTRDSVSPHLSMRWIIIILRGLYELMYIIYLIALPATQWHYIKVRWYFCCFCSYYCWCISIYFVPIIWTHIFSCHTILKIMIFDGYLILYPISCRFISFVFSFSNLLQSRYYSSSLMKINMYEAETKNTKEKAHA